MSELKRRCSVWVLYLSLLLFLSPIPAVAAGSRGFNVALVARTDNNLDLGEVLVNGIPVIRIRTGSGGLDSIARAKIVVARLEQMRQSGQPASQITPGYLRGGCVVQCGQALIVTVGAGDAARNGCSSVELADIWANNLRRALGAPALERRNSLSRGGAKVILGWASWYGPGFDGRETANGETFDQDALTAAHRTLPFDTVVQVTNTRTAKSVFVRINDRGPWVKGRIIDLSRGAAREIGLTDSGIAPVELRVVEGD